MKNAPYQITPQATPRDESTNSNPNEIPKKKKIKIIIILTIVLLILGIISALFASFIQKKRPKL